MVEANADATSGEYVLLMSSGQTAKAYCEFDANNEPFTFFNPSTYKDLTQEDIDYVHINKKNVLFRALNVDGAQPYGIAGQLVEFKK